MWAPNGITRRRAHPALSDRDGPHRARFRLVSMAGACPALTDAARRLLTELQNAWNDYRAAVGMRDDWNVDRYPRRPGPRRLGVRA